MKQKLFNLYNRCKSSFIEEMIDALKTQGTKVIFDPYIKIDGKRDADEFLIEFVEIELEPEDNTWYAHNFVTNTDLSVEEYWTTLSSLSFDELFSIAERI
jgi:hypothetical protein